MHKNNRKYYYPPPTPLVVPLLFLSLFISFFFSTETFAKDVSFTWLANSDPVQGYRLYYKSAGESAGPYEGTGATNGNSPIDVGNTTEYTITGLDDNATYHFVLTAYNGNLESDYTDPVTVSGNDTPVNSSPTIAITKPADNFTAEAGTILTFQAASTDNEDGDLSGSIEWSSSINGSLGTGQTISTTALSGGSHTVTASITDSGGLTSNSSINVSITEPVVDLSPEITITSPASGTIFNTGKVISLTASATDIEDGDLSQQITWVSNLDGSLGSGSSVSTSSLSTGTHTITASVTDSNSQGGTDTTSITIEDSSVSDKDTLLKDLTFSAAYRRQGSGDTVNVEDGGNTYSMSSNDWAKSDDAYTITEDTVLEFEFMSTEEGEIHGIGLDEDGNSKNDQRIFQLFGTEIWKYAIQVDPGYTADDIGTWVKFSIPVGSYYTGQDMQLVLVNDNDSSSSNGTSWFRNIKITNQNQPTEPAFTIEALELTVNHNWQAVNFDTAYNNPIVVAGPPSFNGSDPSTVRIRNVTNEGFEISIQEWDYLDGSHSTETVNLLVMEEGSYTLEDGSKVEAGYFTATSTNQTVSLKQQYTTKPVLVEQVITSNDPTAVTGRIHNISTSSFDYKLQKQESQKTNHTTEESIHYIAWEPGSGLLGNGVSYEVAITPNSVTDDWYTLNFVANSSVMAPLFIADMQTTDGGDTAAVRYQNLSANSIQVNIEEEQSKNDEVSHTTETIGFISINSTQ